jgi:hypothetical protein
MSTKQQNTQIRVRPETRAKLDAICEHGERRWTLAEAIAVLADEHIKRHKVRVKK